MLLQRPHGDHENPSQVAGVDWARKLLKRRLGKIAIGRFIGPDDVVNDYRINNMAHTGLKLLNETGANLLIWCPEPDSNRHGSFRILGILSPTPH